LKCFKVSESQSFRVKDFQASGYSAASWNV
jgi:hypothetical protein